MKFRSPTEEAIHVSLTSGHTAVIPQEGVELDAMFHREAIARGAIPGSLSAEEALVLGAAPAARQFDRAEVIAATIKTMVEAGNEADFNGDGKLKLTVLNKKLGFQASREEVDAVWQKLVAEAQAADGGEDGSETIQA